MTSNNFVHLHLHTDYSLLDGACEIGKLMDRAVALNMPAVAMTDHGNMFGAVKFYEAAKKKGIKPIIGCEVYVAPASRFDRSVDTERPNHLVLLCENEKGYRNLIKLASAAYIEGFYYKPRIDKDMLARHSEGLIGLSACLRGEVSSALMADRYEVARKSAHDLSDIFGKGNFFLEMQDQGMEEEKRINPMMVRLSKESGVDLVVTNDCHYIEAGDARSQEVLVCIQTGKTLSDTNRLKFRTNEFYFKTYQEMAAVFGNDVPDALARTLEIAERCNLKLDTKEHVFPRFDVPPGDSPDSYFEKVTREGFAHRRERLDKMQAAGRLKYPLSAYEERLEREIELIKKMKFPGYFLIVWDFIRHSRDNCIPVGPGRGSAAGSLVAYSLHITDVDPLQNELLFERFLNPERISFPDIDIDFCQRRRGEVIDYVTKKYGRENVSQIITFGTMGAKAVIRDAARALDMPYAEADKIAKLIPTTLNISLEEALVQSAELAQLQKTDERIADLLQVATHLEGFVRHASTHAAGVVISPVPLQEIVPLHKSNKDEITTQYAMDDLEKIGLLKMDFLGLTTLTTIDDCVKLVEKTRGEKLDLESLTLEDAPSYETLGKGLTSGIFQFESRGMTDILRRVKPDKLADLTALNALYRPGPIQGGMVDDFIARRSGKKKVTYDIPMLEKILEETYGVIVYQEQVIQIFNKVGGFSLGEADVVRRAMGKKKIEVMVANKEKFLEGARAQNVSVAKAQKLWDLVEQFAGYGFNKSHSAAYALVAYHTVYLKTHYPVEFMSALLTAEIGNQDKLTRYLAECKDMSIGILPPDVNASDLVFTPDGESIRFGLTAIKNVGPTAIESVIAARQKLGRFENLMEFCENVDLRLLNKRVLESLIKAGAFDSMGVKRTQLLAVLDRAMELGQKRQREADSGQHGLFMGGADSPPPPPFAMPDVPDWTEAERLAAEKEVLGFYVTGHPLEKYSQRLATMTKHDTSSIEEMEHDSTVTLAGILRGLRVKPSKKGDLWASAQLEDLRGTVELLVFPKAYLAMQNILKPDAALLIRGTVRQEENQKPRVSVTDARPLDAAVNGAKTQLRIRMNLEALGDASLNQLADALATHPGESPILFELVRTDDYVVRIQSRAPSGVKTDDILMNRLREICGEEAVRLEKQAPGM